MKLNIRTLVYLSFLVIAFGCQKEDYDSDLVQVENELGLQLKYSHVEYGQVSKKHHDLLKKVTRNSTRFACFRFRVSRKIYKFYKYISNK